MSQNEETRGPIVNGGYMKDIIRGLSCELPPKAINRLLQFLSQKPYQFYIPWCDKIETSTQILAKSSGGFYATATDLQEMEHHTIWELELQIYPLECEKDCFETYEDFANSACLCCLIFYDCGQLDVYIKTASLFKHIQDELLTLKAENLTILTSENDAREALHL